MEQGATATVHHVVSDADTAAAVGSGSVEVLATPRLLALCEQASLAAVEPLLEEGLISVGVEVRLDHVAPSPIGREIRAEATLDKVKGRKLFFTVAAHDDCGLVGVGKVVRVVVNAESFRAKAGVIRSDNADLGSN